MELDSWIQTLDLGFWIWVSGSGFLDLGFWIWTFDLDLWMSTLDPDLGSGPWI